MQADIPRLDYSAPPPLFDPQLLPQNLRLTIETADVWGPNAIAAAWALTKERSDPPGMFVRSDASSPMGDKRSTAWGWGPLVIINGIQHALLFKVSDHATRPAEPTARAAAWAWYERRLALAECLAGFGDFEAARTGSCPWWPVCLFWSDDQVSAVERWMADPAGVDGPAELPEVLRE